LIKKAVAGSCPTDTVFRAGNWDAAAGGKPALHGEGGVVEITGLPNFVVAIPDRRKEAPGRSGPVLPFS
jgi:hypothetical protein